MTPQEVRAECCGSLLGQGLGRSGFGDVAGEKRHVVALPGRVQVDQQVGTAENLGVQVMRELRGRGAVGISRKDPRQVAVVDGARAAVSGECCLVTDRHDGDAAAGQSGLIGCQASRRQDALGLIAVDSAEHHDTRAGLGGRGSPDIEAASFPRRDPSVGVADHDDASYAASTVPMSSALM